MKLERYLQYKYGNSAIGLTAIEARHFGVPYPLKSGWQKRNADLQITPGMAERVLHAFSQDGSKGGKDKFREKAIALLRQVLQMAHLHIPSSNPPWEQEAAPSIRTVINIDAKTVAAIEPPVSREDVRLNANIREDLHLKLKIASVTRRTTMGELLEELIERHL